MGTLESCRRRVAKPIREQIGHTTATAKQEHKGLIWQRSDGVLSSVDINLVRQSAVVDDSVGCKAKAARWRKDAIATVAKALAVGCDRDGRIDGEAMRNDEVAVP